MMPDVIEIKTTVCPDGGFSNCSTLRKAEIYGADIGKSAFSSCARLETIRIIQGSSSSAVRLDNTNAFPTNLKTIFVTTGFLKTYKTATNWVQYADKIYPEGGSYSETVTISVANWVDNAQTVEVVGSTAEARNVIEFVLVDSNGNQIEDVYGLTATQGTMSMIFTCQTVPTEDIQVFIKSTLTNY
jgi:hypothetical protein